MKTLFPIVAFCITMAILTAFTTPIPEQDLDKLLKRMNTELPTEAGCDNTVYTFNGCTLNMNITCGGNQFSINVPMNNLQRVYMDQGDLDDEFMTVFFACGRGSSCITSEGGLPDQPVFPVKLAKGQEDDLGKKMLEVFGSMVGNCNK